MRDRLASDAAWERMAERGDGSLVSRWSYVPRNFYMLATPGPAPIASDSLEHIATLYAIEKDIRGRNAEERRLVRQHVVAGRNTIKIRWSERGCITR